MFDLFREIKRITQVHCAIMGYPVPRLRRSRFTRRVESGWAWAYRNGLLQECGIARSREQAVRSLLRARSEARKVRAYLAQIKARAK